MQPKVREMKVFGIGLSKTGTQSLAIALRMLGFTVIHYPWNWDDILKHDAACDIPIAARFKLLDAMFPDAKFIMTIRERQAWLKSCSKHFTEDSTKEPWRGRPAREWMPSEAHIADVEMQIYGTWLYDEVLFSGAYDRHVWSVRKHFGSDENKLLTLDICGGDEWGPLFDFLGIHGCAFPWENRTND